MRTVIVCMVLLSCMVAWGAEKSDRSARQFLFELRLDLSTSQITPQLMDTLSLAGSDSYLQREAMKLELFRQFTAQLFKSDMKKAMMKKQMLDSIARGGKEDEPDDAIYQGGDEEGSGEEAPAAADARAARVRGSREDDRHHELLLGAHARDGERPCGAAGRDGPRHGADVPDVHRQQWRA